MNIGKLVCTGTQCHNIQLSTMFTHANGTRLLQNNYTHHNLVLCLFTLEMMDYIGLSIFFNSVAGSKQRTEPQSYLHYKDI